MPDAGAGLICGRPPQAHIVGGRNPVTPPPVPTVANDEIEQLPRYEAPPPQYERVVKADEQRPVVMRDLERGESSGTTASGGADGGASIRRADTDGSQAGEPLPPPVGVLFVRRVFSGFGPFSR